MDHERLPPSENIISPPQHPSAEEIHPPIQPGDFFDPSNLRTTPARVETGNLISYSENVVSESPNSEKLGVSLRIYSFIICLNNRSMINHQSIQSPLPVHLPEPEKRDANMVNNERYQQNTTTRTQRQGNGIDWIVPTEEGELVSKIPKSVNARSTFQKLEKHTVKDRLQPTLEAAIVEKNKCIAKAKWTGLMLNVAIGMQVLLGSLTTGLSAVAVSGGKSVNTSVFFL